MCRYASPYSPGSTCPAGAVRASCHCAKADWISLDSSPDCPACGRRWLIELVIGDTAPDRLAPSGAIANATTAEPAIAKAVRRRTWMLELGTQHSSRTTGRHGVCRPGGARERTAREAGFQPISDLR